MGSESTYIFLSGFSCAVRFAHITGYEIVCSVSLPFSVLWIYHHWFIDSIANGNLGCFQPWLLQIVHVFWDMRVSFLLVCILRSGIVGLSDMPMFSLKIYFLLTVFMWFFQSSGWNCGWMFLELLMSLVKGNVSTFLRLQILASPIPKMVQKRCA